METIQGHVADKIQEHLSGLYASVKTKQRQRNKIRGESKELEKEFQNMVELAKYSNNLSDALKLKLDELVVQIKEKQLSLKLDTAEDVISLRLGDMNMGGIFNTEGELLISYEELDAEKRQMILRELVNKIFVRSDGSIDIEWKDK